MAPLVEKGLALGHALGRHGLDLARRDDLGAEEVPDHEVALVADDRGRPGDAEQEEDVEPAALREEPRGKEQGVSGEEREEHDARLDEDDEEDAAVGGKRTGCDPAGDGRARISEQVDDEVYEAHVHQSRDVYENVLGPMVGLGTS